MKSNISLWNEDCLQAMKLIEDNSVDSLITDPPAGISFMGKEWDDDKGGRDAWVSWMSQVMKECLRVLKPGAHGLVWAIPRTSHWTATALEDAGFEIRDVVTHIFGSGFPKSLDISKAIDKAAGVEREVVGKSNRHSGGTNNNYAQDEWTKANASTMGMYITAPATPEAKQWQGFGTALKPASEHWILVRKPLSEKTVASNVLKHGTGGINIDASRIGLEPTVNLNAKQKNFDAMGFGGNEGTSEVSTYNPSGRFPANLVLSHNLDCEEQCTPGCAVAMLDAQSGTLSPGHTPKLGSSSSPIFKRNPKVETEKHWGSGGASRFFYCAKASKTDKGTGNTHPTVKSTKLMSYLIKLITPPNGVVLDPFMGSGSTGVAALRGGFKFIGIEAQIEYVEIAQMRIESESILI